MKERYYLYCVTNLINNKIYIGKTNDPKDRWRKHRKFARGGKKKYSNDFSVIHAAIKKYEENNFKFEILEEFNNEKESYKFETWWIDFLGSHKDLKKGYNLNYGGEGGILPSEETRQKLIAAQNTPERKKQQSELMKKRHKDNPGFLSNINKGQQYCKGKKHSIESKKKMSESHKNNNHRGENIANSKLTNNQVLDIRKEYIKGYVSQKEIASKYGVSSSIISDIINRKSWKHI